MKTVRLLFLFTCCLLVAIGPFNVLQLVAWGNMINEYSADRTFTEATEMTLSGEYPCEMCRRIAKAKAEVIEEEKPAPLPSEERLGLRLDLVCRYESDKADLFWKMELSFSPGILTFHAPLPRFQRVPTPPPQPLAC